MNRQIVRFRVYQVAYNILYSYDRSGRDQNQYEFCRSEQQPEPVEMLAINRLLMGGGGGSKVWSRDGAEGGMIKE